MRDVKDEMSRAILYFSFHISHFTSHIKTMLLVFKRFITETRTILFILQCMNIARKAMLFIL